MTTRCLHRDQAGMDDCTRPARYVVWGHLFTKEEKGPRCRRHLPESVGQWNPLGSLPAVYEIPATVLTPAPTNTVSVDWEYGALSHLTGRVDSIEDRPEYVKLGRSMRHEESDWTPDVLVRRVKAGEWEPDND